MLKNPFKDSQEHLKASRMGYWYHCGHSLHNGWRCLVIAGSSLVHAFFPNLLKQHAARRLVRIYLDMKEHAHLRKMMSEEETFKQARDRLKYSGKL